MVCVKGRCRGHVWGKDRSLADPPVTDTDRPSPSGTSTKRTSLPARDVGMALRKAFEATVEEDVPNELLDLLRRLD